MRLHKLAVQTSASPTGAPQAALVGFAVTDQFEIVFDTLETTRKAQNLRKNSRIALVIGGWISGDERTVQYEGEPMNLPVRNSSASSGSIIRHTPMAPAAQAGPA